MGRVAPYLQTPSVFGLAVDWLGLDWLGLTWLALRLCVRPLGPRVSR